MPPLTQQAIRRALATLPPAGARKAAEPPAIEEIFAPPSHENALDSDRALVIGNRGSGKSFWSGVLANSGTRDHVAKFYRRLNLEKMVVALGFHESAAASGGPAPSPRLLQELSNGNHNAEDIWRAVLLRALGTHIAFDLPKSQLSRDAVHRLYLADAA